MGSTRASQTPGDSSPEGLETEAAEHDRPTPAFRGVIAHELVHGPGQPQPAPRFLRHGGQRLVRRGLAV